MKIAKIPFTRQFMMQGHGISKDLFKRILDLLPDDASFVGCGQDGSSCLDYMFFSSDSFKDVGPAELIPYLDVHFSVKNNVISVDKVVYDGGKGPCVHSWKTYTGMNDTYVYCDLCGTKQ